LVDSKSKDNKSKETDTRVVVKSSNVTKSISEIAEENYTRLTDVFTKIQPNYTQAISNLQSDYIKSIKNFIEASSLVQEYLLFTNLFNWSNTPLAALYIQQSDALTNNIIRSLDIYTQLSINAIQAAGSILKTCCDVVKAGAEGFIQKERQA
jgi:hypothetical protein